jgi:beta-galactosidase GanA
LIAHARLVRRFYGTIAEHAKRHRSFYAYDLWSEPHIINWAIINYIPDAQFCFCSHTLAKFRQWLNRRYGSLEALNAAWYRGFARWDQVVLRPGSLTLVGDPKQSIYRFRRADEVFKRKFWREQLREWNETFKPTSIEAHRKLRHGRKDVHGRGYAIRKPDPCESGPEHRQ